MVLRFRYQEVLLTAFLAVVMVRNVPFGERQLIDPAEAAEGGGIGKQVLYVSFFAAMALPLLRGKLRSLSLPLPILVLLAFGALSMTWSLVPLVAMRRLILTALVTLTLLTATAQIRPRNALLILRAVALALCVATVLAGIVAPKLAIHQVGDIEAGLAGYWHGIFSHKNMAGSVAGLALVLWADAFLRSPERVVTGLVSTGLAALTLYLTMSKTSMIAAFLAVVVMISFKSIIRIEGHNRTPAALLRTSIAVAGMSILLLVWFTIPIDRYILDPQAFTGRGTIWAIVTRLIAERPLLGYGYQSVFLAGDASVFAQTATAWVRRMPSSHNGILDLLVTVGAVGTLLFVWAMLVDPWRRLQQLPDSVRHAWEPAFAGLTAYTLIHSLMEGNTFFGLTIEWVILVLLLGIVVRLSNVAAQPHPRVVAATRS